MICVSIFMKGALEGSTESGSGEAGNLKDLYTCRFIQSFIISGHRHKHVN